MFPFTAVTGQKNAQLCKYDACEGFRCDYAATHIADYYPFGMEIQRGTDPIHPPSGNLLNNHYLYNGKEQQDDFGLDWGVYPDPFGNYGARFYDAQIALCHSFTSRTENFVNISPSAKAANSAFISNHLSSNGTGQALSLLLGL